MVDSVGFCLVDLFNILPLQGDEIVACWWRIADRTKHSPAVLNPEPVKLNTQHVQQTA